MNKEERLKLTSDDKMRFLSQMRHLKSALDVEDMWTGKSSGSRSPAYYTCVISQLIPLRAGLFMKSLNSKNGESTFLFFIKDSSLLHSLQNSKLRFKTDR